MPNETEQQATAKPKAATIGGSVTLDEKGEVERAGAEAGYPKVSHFVRDVMLTVSRSPDARKAVLAVLGRIDRRAA